MLSNIINRSAAAFGGTPFRLSKCTALGPAGSGAAGGAGAINAASTYSSLGVYTSIAGQVGTQGGYGNTSASSVTVSQSR